MFAEYCVKKAQTESGCKALVNIPFKDKTLKCIFIFVTVLDFVVLNHGEKMFSLCRLMI